MSKKNKLSAYERRQKLNNQMKQKMPQPKKFTGIINRFSKNHHMIPVITAGWRDGYLVSNTSYAGKNYYPNENEIETLLVVFDSFNSEYNMFIRTAVIFTENDIIAKGEYVIEKNEYKKLIPKNVVLTLFTEICKKVKHRFNHALLIAQ